MRICKQRRISHFQESVRKESLADRYPLHHVAEG